MGFPSRALSHITVGLLALSNATAEEKELLIIGDSLSREYQFEFPEFEDARNWVEILAEHRPEEFDFGIVRTLDLTFIDEDLDLTRYEYNWSLPTYTAEEYRDELTGSGLDDRLFQSLIDPDFDAVDAVVVFLGGNDFDSRYGSIYNGSTSAANEISQRITDDLEDIIDHVLDENDDLQVVLVNIPHVGATPEVKGDHPTDPVKTQRVTDALNALNTDLAALAQEKDIGYADVAGLTIDLLDDGPLLIGGFPFINEGDDDGDPRYVWLGGDLSQNFHPNTQGQAIIANAIIDAFNAKYDCDFTRLGNREIVESIVGLDYDEIYDNWTGSFPITDVGFCDDPDADGLKNILEFAFERDPSEPDAGSVFNMNHESGTLALTWTPRSDGVEYVTITPQFSPDGTTWTAVDPTDIVENPDGSFTVSIVVEGTEIFARLQVSVTE